MNCLLLIPRNILVIKKLIVILMTNTKLRRLTHESNMCNVCEQKLDCKQCNRWFKRPHFPPKCQFCWCDRRKIMAIILFWYYLLFNLPRFSFILVFQMTRQRCFVNGQLHRMCARVGALASGEISVKYLSSTHYSGRATSHSVH